MFAEAEVLTIWLPLIFEKIACAKADEVRFRGIMAQTPPGPKSDGLGGNGRNIPIFR
jgi:hypothetical protein